MSPIESLVLLVDSSATQAYSGRKMDYDFIENLLNARRSMPQALADLREKCLGDRSPHLRRMIEILETEIAERAQRARCQVEPSLGCGLD